MKQVRLGESVFNTLVLRVLEILVRITVHRTHWRLVLQIDHV